MRNLFLLFVLCFASFSIANAQVHSGNLNIFGQANVDAFNYTEVTGNLIIASSKASGDLVIDLSSLSGLTKVGGFLQINTTDVADLSGLADLQTVGGNLIITVNPKASNITLAKLSSVGGLLVIGADDVLKDINLPSLTTVNGDLRIYDNPALTNVNFSSLTTLNGEFSIERNNSLTNLDGFSALNSVSKNLTVRSNNALNDCCILKSLLNTPGAVTGSIIINSNKTNCNSKDEILTTCADASEPATACGSGQYKLDEKGEIYYVTNGNVKIGSNTQSLECLNGTLVATLKNNTRLYYLKSLNRWSNEPPVAEKTVICNAVNYKLDESGEIYSASCGNIKIGSNTQSLECEGSNLVATLRNNARLYYLVSLNRWSNEPPVEEKTVTCHSVDYKLDESGEIYNVSNGSYLKIGANTKNLECENGKLVATLRNNTRLYYLKSLNRWSGNSPVEEKTVTCNSVDYKLDENGDIYDVTNGNVRIGGNTTKLECTSGKLTATIRNGTTLSYQGTPGKWGR